MATKLAAPAFLAPVPWAPCAPACVAAAARQRPHARRARSAMSAARPGGGPGPNDFPPPEESPFGPRGPEFGITGDASLQDDLVKELQWQAHRVAHSEYLDFYVSAEMYKTREHLDQWYAAEGRGIIERGDELAEQQSLEDIAKWNQEVLQGHRKSQVYRAELNQERAVVEALLNRHRRLKQSRSIMRYRPPIKRTRAARRALVRFYALLSGLVVMTVTMATLDHLLVRYGSTAPQLFEKLTMLSVAAIATSGLWALGRNQHPVDQEHGPLP